MTNKNAKKVCLTLITALAAGAIFIEPLWAAQSSTPQSGTTDTGTSTVTTTVATSSGSASSASVPNMSQSSGSSGSSSSASSTPTTKSDANMKKATEQKEKDAMDVKYTGIYNDRQIIPNTMAIFCKVNGEDIITDNAKLHNCVNKIIKKLKNENADVAQEGLSDYEKIKYEELKILLSQAIAKGASAANYEEVQDQMGSSVSQGVTEHEDNVGIAMTTSVTTDVINSMREVYAERLKSMAIDGFNYVNADIIEDMVEASTSVEEKAKQESIDAYDKQVASEVSDSIVNSITTVYTEQHPYISPWEYVSRNQCIRTICTGTVITNGTDASTGDFSDANCRGEEKTCPNGLYQNAEPPVFCYNQTCEQYVEQVDDDAARQAMCDVSIQAQDYLATCSIVDSTNEIACPDGKYRMENGTVMGCKNKQCILCSNS